MRPDLESNILPSARPTRSISILSYHICWAWFCWKIVWKWLVWFARSKWIVDVCGAYVRDRMAFSRPAHGNPSGLTYVSSHCVFQSKPCDSIVKILLLTKMYVGYYSGILCKLKRDIVALMLTLLYQFFITVHHLTCTQIERKAQCNNICCTSTFDFFVQFQSFQFSFNHTHQAIAFWLVGGDHLPQHFLALSLAALLELSSPVIYNSRVLPICLATTNMEFPPGKTCFITGWGTKGWNRPQSNFLQEAPIRLVSRDECNEKKSYNGTVPPTALCAGFQDGNIDACQKDSGGPLACEYDGRWYLVGVISWGKKCALPNKYGVYADVRVLRTWITNVIQHLNQQME